VVVKKRATASVQCSQQKNLVRSFETKGFEFLFLCDVIIVVDLHNPPSMNQPAAY
jgi:hypothetical protein